MTFKKPLDCTPPLAAYDETYVRRKQEVAEREQMFTCKSGRKFCYFTDGASDPSVEGVSVVLCLHACGQGRHQFMQREPFANIFQICQIFPDPPIVPRSARFSQISPDPNRLNRLGPLNRLTRHV